MTYAKSIPITIDQTRCDLSFSQKHHPLAKHIPILSNHSSNQPIASPQQTPNQPPFANQPFHKTHPRKPQYTYIRGKPGVRATRGSGRKSRAACTCSAGLNEATPRNSGPVALRDSRPPSGEAARKERPSHAPNLAIGIFGLLSLPLSRSLQLSGRLRRGESEREGGKGGAGARKTSL